MGNGSSIPPYPIYGVRYVYSNSQSKIYIRLLRFLYHCVQEMLLHRLLQTFRWNWHKRSEKVGNTNLLLHILFFFLNFYLLKRFLWNKTFISIGSPVAEAKFYCEYDDSNINQRKRMPLIGEPRICSGIGSKFVAGIYFFIKLFLWEIMKCYYEIQERSI